MIGCHKKTATEKICEKNFNSIDFEKYLGMEFKYFKENIKTKWLKYYISGEFENINSVSFVLPDSIVCYVNIIPPIKKISDDSFNPYTKSNQKKLLDSFQNRKITHIVISHWSLNKPAIIIFEKLLKKVG